MLKQNKKDRSAKLQTCLWWIRRGSNPRPYGCEPYALPAELRTHMKFMRTAWQPPLPHPRLFGTRTCPLALPAALQAHVGILREGPTPLPCRLNYTMSSFTASSSTRMWMEEMGCSKESMMASEMGFSSICWMVRRRLRAP